MTDAGTSRQSFPANGVVIGAMGAFIAWAIRLAVDPWVHDQSPYIMAVSAAIIVTIYAGALSGVVAIIVGGLADNFSFVGRPNSLDFSGNYKWTFIVFLTASILTIFAVSVASRVRSRRSELINPRAASVIYGRSNRTVLAAIDQNDKDTILSAIRLQKKFLKKVNIFQEGGEIYKRYTESLEIDNLIELAVCHANNVHIIYIIDTIFNIEKDIKMRTVWHGNDAMSFYSTECYTEKLREMESLLNKIPVE